MTDLEERATTSSDAVEVVRAYVDSTLGDASDNTCWEVAAEQGVTFANVYDAMMEAMARAKAKHGPKYYVPGADGFAVSAALRQRPLQRVPADAGQCLVDLGLELRLPLLGRHRQPPRRPAPTVLASATSISRLHQRPRSSVLLRRPQFPQGYDAQAAQP